MPVLKSNTKGTDWSDELDAIRRGRVLKLDLSGAAGSEMQGPHFCVVVSSDVLNKGFSVIAVPLTTHSGGAKAKAYEVPLDAGDGGLPQAGFALPNQIRTIDKNARVTEIWGTLSAEKMRDIEDQVLYVLQVDVDEE